jgi:transporter family-2 protein
MIFLAIISAFAAGITIVISRILNANLAQKIGLIQGTVFNYITGLSLATVIFLVLGNKSHMTSEVFQNIPIWAFFGGLVGILVVSLSSFMTHKISTFYLTLFIFIGQLVCGMLIDHFRGLDISLGKIVGGTLVLTGLIFNLVLDRKTKYSEQIIPNK